MEYVEVKSILSRVREADPWFGISYNMNLYRGCQHGCIYCDTRSECYGIGDISHIKVKSNALRLLSSELRSKRHKATVGTGSMNDPYMPLEKETGLTRGALEIIAGRHFPVHVITKGELVFRDKDILQDISQTYAAVSFSLTTGNDSLARKLEPGASPPSLRLKAMEKLSEAGIYTGITMMPALPFITDTLLNMEDMLRRASDSGARYVIPMFGMTLRAGNREYYYEMLDRHFPFTKERYIHTYGDRYVCDSPEKRRLEEAFRKLTQKLGLADSMEFYSPPKESQLSLF
jgi:DNA repair photolyase